MAKLLRGLEKFCLPYLDKAIFLESWEEHIVHLREVLMRIREVKKYRKIVKSKFAQKTVKYLGHIAGEGQRKPAEAKIKAITELPPPKTKTEIRRCLGMAGYYLSYIKYYASIIELLTRALKGKNKKEKVTRNGNKNLFITILIVCDNDLL